MVETQASGHAETLGVRVIQQRELSNQCSSLLPPKEQRLLPMCKSIRGCVAELHLVKLSPKPLRGFRSVLANLLCFLQSMCTAAHRTSLTNGKLQNRCNQLPLYFYNQCPCNRTPSDCCHSTLCINVPKLIFMAKHLYSPVLPLNLLRETFFPVKTSLFVLFIVSAQFFVLACSLHMQEFFVLHETAQEMSYLIVTMVLNSFPCLLVISPDLSHFIENPTNCF